MNHQNEDHLDLRQKKTRRLLVEALAQLLTERPFQELSVVDICRRAMVHRTTFYAHFNDKQELLHYLLEGLEQECVATCLPQDPDRSPPGISADSRPKCLPVFCTAPDIVSGLSEQRRRHPRSNPGGVRCRGTLPPAVRAPFSGSLPAGGPGGGRPLLYRSHALSFVGGSPAIRRSPPVISWPIWNNSFPFSEAQLCRKNAQKVP